MFARIYLPLITALVIAAALIIALVFLKRAKRYKTMTQKRMRLQMDKGEKIILLDVRNIDEYELGHMEGSRLLPLGKLNDEIESVVSNKKQMICVYCASGIRSKKAAESLTKKGYTRVYDLGGYSPE